MRGHAAARYTVLMEGTGTMNNLKTVQEIYAAFGRGDVPAILERLADDIEWEYGFASSEVPWLARRRGRAEVMQFFQALGALEFRRFAPKTVLEGDGVVVALVDLEVVVRETGRTITEEDEVHVWRFDAAGRVKRFRPCLDTHQHVVAWRR